MLSVVFIDSTQSPHISGEIPTAQEDLLLIPTSYVIIYLYPHTHCLSPFYRQGVQRRYTRNITTGLIDSEGEVFPRDAAHRKDDLSFN